jgi:hypothetical protein
MENVAFRLLDNSMSIAEIAQPILSFVRDHEPIFRTEDVGSENESLNGEFERLSMLTMAITQLS